MIDFYMLLQKKYYLRKQINNFQPTIKELCKLDKYCDEIRKRSESIEEKLNNFDRNVQKEKDNSRSL